MIATKHLTFLDLEVRKALKNQSEALLHQWPVGSRVKFLLSSGQKNPSEGEVLGVHEGRFAICLFSLNRRGCRTVKHVEWTAIIPS